MSFILFGKNRESINYRDINHTTVQKIAQALLTRYVLVVNDIEYQLAEIEFYVKSVDHNDQYTHGDANQKKFGKWYFHRYGNGSYKAGTYKGLDLTLGDGTTYFGVLIRSIYDNVNKEMIEGPCRTVNRILELNGCQDVAEYMQNKKDPLSARSTKNFYLMRKAKPFDETLYIGPRIGLSDKYPEWRDVNYRYVSKINLIKKERNKLIEL
jgi:3-methyladenine DNA glycosylase Mpg